MFEIAYEAKRDFFRSKKVLVCGLQRSGMDAAALLLKCGASVTACDVKKPEELSEQIAGLMALGGDLAFELGEHRPETFAAQDLIVLSPAVPCDSPFVLHAISKGVEVVSEVEFACRFVRAPYAAITGTNGKTTTTTLVHEILKESELFEKVFVGGNIGVAFAGFAAEMGPRDAAVLEISSFQMEFASTFAPRAAALLNITEDHLNRHGDMRTYTGMKMRVFRNQRASDCAVLNADDPRVMAERDNIASRRVTFTVTPDASCDAFVEGGYLCLKTSGGGFEKVIRTEDIGIIGRHNLSNSAAAAALCHFGFGVEPAVIAKVLRAFRGVHHRLEFVGEVGGVRFYNDSKATNEDSTRVALASFTGPVALIAGGSDKGSDFSALAADVTGSSVKKVFVLGQVRDKIRDALGRSGFVETFAADTLEECVRKAYEASEPGWTVLLSPACASLDMFKNYEHRGEVFIEAVKKLQAAEA